uniref:Uncharacterized protein n=1 Tax=Sus scrofa TaxID=9823 RepID=A0A4X1STE8_PIG
MGDSASTMENSQAPSLPAPRLGGLASSADSVALTLALASRVASASAAMDLCSCTGIRTSLISTRATRIPHSSVASSNLCWNSAFYRAGTPVSLIPAIFSLLSFIQLVNCSAA